MAFVCILSKAVGRVLEPFDSVYLMLVRIFFLNYFSQLLLLLLSPFSNHSREPSLRAVWFFPHAP